MKIIVYSSTAFFRLSKFLPFPPLQEVGDDDADVGVFGADLDAGGENAVPFLSLFPSDKTVNLGDAGDGVRGDLTKVVIFRENKFISFTNKITNKLNV